MILKFTIFTLYICLGILTPFLLSSCFSLKTDVSEETKLWGEFIPNGNYELVRDVFLVRPDNHIFDYKDGRSKVIENSSDRLALTPEGSLCQNAGFYSAPNTILEYENDPEESVKKDYDLFISFIDVVGVVRKGTKIRCSRLEKESGLRILSPQ